MNLTFPPCRYCQWKGQKLVEVFRSLQCWVGLSWENLRGSLSARASDPARSTSLTGEEVKTIWLIHLTIFIFIAQSDKLIGMLTNQLPVMRITWSVWTNGGPGSCYQTKFAKLIWPLTKNKSQSVGPVKSSMIIDQLASADSETFTRLILFSLISHFPPANVQTAVDDGWWFIFTYLLISIFTFANLFSVKNFNWLSGCL